MKDMALDCTITVIILCSAWLIRLLIVVATAEEPPEPDQIVEVNKYRCDGWSVKETIYIDRDGDRYTYTYCKKE